MLAKLDARLATAIARAPLSSRRTLRINSQRGVGRRAASSQTNSSGSGPRRRAPSYSVRAPVGAARHRSACCVSSSGATIAVSYDGAAPGANAKWVVVATSSHSSSRAAITPLHAASRKVEIVEPFRSPPGATYLA